MTADRLRPVPLACLAAFAVAFGLSAVAPSYREHWLLEHGLTFIAVPLAVLTYRRFPFSDRAYVQITAFLLLHTLGAHYTYSEVPLGNWVKEALGHSRNHYDRLVHTSFGLLLLRPLRELIARATPGARPATTIVLAWACVAALSTIYELIEWGAAIVVDPKAGTAFLGTQGDVWDAQKDTALALLGGLAAALVELRARDPGAAAARGRTERGGARSADAAAAESA